MDNIGYSKWGYSRMKTILRDSFGPILKQFYEVK